ncbi:hypothetical protein Tco_1296025 [Tanacetum coccineum]
MTDSTKDMFNVVDISNLMLTVSHPNGTLAKITAIGSLRLTSGIVLFDVLVVLEYNVILLFVNKMIKDSKFIVSFDEHKCYIQNLKLCKIVGTGSETGGLFLFGVNKTDIIAACSENHPPMLNKDNYVPWSSRLLRYAKSKPNGKLIYNSIMHGPYVRRMIPKPGNPDREVPVAKTFHEQTDKELSDKEVKQMEADDQVIQTILMGLL